MVVEQVRPRTPALVACSLALAVLLSAPGARADTEGEAARAAYNRGQTEYNLGNYTEALKSFEEACRIKPVPALLFNIAHRRPGDGR